jgi:hypothetical protein
MCVLYWQKQIVQIETQRVASIRLQNGVDAGLDGLKIQTLIS